MLDWGNFTPKTEREREAFARGMAIGNQAAVYALVGVRCPVRIVVDPSLSDDEGVLRISPNHRLLNRMNPLQVEAVTEGGG